MDMNQIKAQLVDQLTRALAQLVPQIVDQMIPSELPVDKAKAFSQMTTQELLAEVSRRVG